VDNEEKVQAIFTKRHYINLVSCLIIWFSGVLFIIKTFDDPALKIIFYSLIFAIVSILIERTEKYYKFFLTKNYLFLTMLIVTAAVILLYRSDYIGYPSIGGFSILWLAVMYQAQNVKVALLQLVIFLLSPVLYSELIAFTGIFALTMLVIISVLLSERFLDVNKYDWKFILGAFLFGVTLAAHLLVGFVYIIYLLYRFRNDFGKGLVFVLMMLVAYALLLFLGDKGHISIAASHANYFQFIPVWIIIFLVIVSLYIGWIVADLQEVLFTSGLIYFISFITSFLFKVAQFGWNNEAIELSLMIVAIPFLVLSIKDYKVDRFLGKVLE